MSGTGGTAPPLTHSGHGAVHQAWSRRQWAALWVGIAASSAAVIAFEIVLTRVFAVAQFYHFAFLTVSLALLGFGASGSVLTAFPGLGRGGPRRWALLALTQSIGTVGAYAVTNRIPFDSFSIAWDTTQVLYLAIYYVALAVPFFFGGAVLGTLLSGWDQPESIPSHRVYGAGLAGSGAGALVALAGAEFLGGVGVIFVAALLALTAALAFSWAGDPRWSAAVVGGAVLAVLLGVAAVMPPAFMDVRLSQYKGLSAVLRFPDAEIVSTDWDTAGRIDHVRSEAIRSLPGLSFTYLGDPPPQEGVTFDGDDLNPIPRVTPADADFVPYLLTSLPFSLHPEGEALILEPRGGLDVLVALASGSGSVVAVEPNEAALSAARSAAPDPYGDPRVEVVVAEPRSYVERTDRRFDVIDLALTAPYRPVTSGAYSLGEDYTLTTEAFAAYLQRLRPGGMLAAMRWLQTPPSEESRLVALAGEAARHAGAEPTKAVVALRGFSAALVIVKPDHFTDGELAQIRRFADERRFDLIAAPDLSGEEANRYNRLPEDEYYPLAADLLAAPDPSDVYAGSDFAIAPPTDDHPFFGHFFTWAQAAAVLDTLGRTWQPFGGAGYFVLLAFLGLAVAAAAVLIVAPLGVARLRQGRTGGPGRGGPRLWTLAYFGLLGVAFLFVEIPIIQQYILLVGRPTTALAVVLFALLLSSGLGSLWSRRIRWRWGAVGLVGAIAAYPFVIRWLTGGVLFAPLGVRLLLGGVMLFPLGFLMGTMFPKGLAYLEDRAPHLIPWAWGVNGTMSVISGAAAALLALSFGFSVVVLAGGACYALCIPLVRPGELTTRPG